MSAPYLEAEIRRSKDCTLLKLPVGLRVLIYEELLLHNGTGHQTVWPQILLTCKQIHHEAQPILEENVKRIALYRIDATDEGMTMRFGQEAPVEVEHISHLDVAFDAMPPIPKKSTFAIICIQLTERDSQPRMDDAFLLSKHLYLLATQCTQAKLKTLLIRVKADTAIGKDVGCKALEWSIENLNAQILMEVVSDDISSRFWERKTLFGRSGDLGLSRWLNLRREVIDMAAAIEEAGLQHGADMQCLRDMCSNGDLLTMDEGYSVPTMDRITREAVRNVRRRLYTYEWFDLGEKAFSVLRERKQIRDGNSDG